jgi:hypothetical protein
MSDLKGYRSIGVVCHDAGGANQVLSFLETQNNIDVKIYFEGPALKILQDSDFHDSQLDDFEKVFENVDLILTGTGWASDLEYKAIVRAKNKNIYCISILDHWVNYRERFERNSIEQYPNEVWVVDKYAEEKALNELPENINIILSNDYYSDKISEGIKSYSDIKSNNLLYLCEPIRSNWQRDELGEFQALRFFLNHVHKIPENYNNIKLKLHPSEKKDKYNHIISKGKYDINFAGDSLIEEISKSTVVVGCHTYPLSLALKTNRKAYCSIPPWGPNCKLPHKEIKYLRDL